MKNIRILIWKLKLSNDTIDKSFMIELLWCYHLVIFKVLQVNIIAIFIQWKVHSNAIFRAPYDDKPN